MLLILASRHDEEAASLETEWSGMHAQRLTCEDLGTVGWQWTPGKPGHSRLAVAGTLVSAAEIRGVLVRLQSVTEAELPHIDPVDRDFVAAELTAFLAAWLPELRCPVLNRPTPTQLDGPAWTPDRWLIEARRVGMNVSDQPRDFRLGTEPVTTAEPDSCSTATVVGDRCFGVPDEAASTHAQRLARAASVSLLSVRFANRPSGFEFREASLCPALCTPEIKAAVLELLTSAR
jgi:hypothetical protein